MTRWLAATLVLLAITGCSRNVSPSTESTPTSSASGLVPPMITVAATDFPSAWLAEQVGGEAVLVERVSAADIPGVDADLLAYVPGLDAAVDAALAQVPGDRVVDLTEDVRLLAYPADRTRKDPYVWFDPANLGPMANTLASAMTEASTDPVIAVDYYGFGAVVVQNQGLEADRRNQDLLSSCRVANLVVDRPVLTYFSRAYGFDQIPTLLWDLEQAPVTALYATPDTRPAVRKVAGDLPVVTIDDLSRRAPSDDLLQGVLDTADIVAEHQNCPPAPSLSPTPER